MIRTDLRYALDPCAFSSEICKKEPDPWQQTVLLSNKKLLMNCTRQAGKSTVAAIKALHRAIYYPGSTIIVISKTEQQSKLLLDKLKAFYKLVPNQPQPEEENKTSLKLKNGSWIKALPGNQPDNVRGFSAVDLLIEDEAAFVYDRLYYAILPMLAVSRGKLILMSTPNGKRGHFFQEYTGDGDWIRVKIPWQDCPRIFPSDIEEYKKSMGQWHFKQEFECEFGENLDNVFSFDSIMKAMTEDIEPLYPVMSGLSDEGKPLYEGGIP